MSWRVALLFALCAALAMQQIAGQEPACSSAKTKRQRAFVGGTLNQGSALTLTPPSNQAVLPARFCEFWTVRPDQIQNTTCYPNSPSAGLSYLLIELWLGASWNTTGTSPNWDDVTLSVYRMSNMDDRTWAQRKKTGYGYTRYLDKTNGMAYHRVVVSTYQQPGAAARDNTTINNMFDLDYWFMSIDNQDAIRSSNGYTLKVSCVDPNSLPCPSSDPVGQECNSRGTCMANVTDLAPTNHCQCTGDFVGYACQTSTAVPIDPSSSAQAQGQAQLDGLAFGVDSTISTGSISSSQKKSSFDARWLLFLLIIPIAILGFLVWRSVTASKRVGQKVADDEAAVKPIVPDNGNDQMQIRIDPLVVPTTTYPTIIQEAPVKPKWAPAPPVVVKKPPPNQYPYVKIQVDTVKDKEKEKDIDKEAKDRDTNSSITEAPVAVDNARQRFYAERSERERRHAGSRDDKRSGSRGRRDEKPSTQRTHTLRSVDLEEYNRMMRSGATEEEGLYYRRDRMGRDILTSFDRESFRESTSIHKGHASHHSRDIMSSYDDLTSLADGYDTHRSSRRGGDDPYSSRSRRGGDDPYYSHSHRSGSASRRHGHSDRRHGSSDHRRHGTSGRPELDTMESDYSERQRRLVSQSDTEADSFLDFTPSVMEGGQPSRRTPPRGGRYESDREAQLYREQPTAATLQNGRSTFTKKRKGGDDGSKRFSSPAATHKVRGYDEDLEAKGVKTASRKSQDLKSRELKSWEVKTWELDSREFDVVGDPKQAKSTDKRSKDGDKSSRKSVRKSKSYSKIREDVGDASLMETHDTVDTMGTLGDARHETRKGRRHEEDMGAMVEAALCRDNEKEQRWLEKKGKERAAPMERETEDPSSLEEAKSDQVSRLSIISKYSKDSDKMLSKLERKAARKLAAQAAVDGDVPSSSSGPSFQKTNRRAQEQIPEQPEKAPEELAAEEAETAAKQEVEAAKKEAEAAKKEAAAAKKEAAAAKKEAEAAKKEAEATEAAAKKAAQEGEAAAKKGAEEEAKAAAYEEVNAAEAAAKKAAEERRKRFAAILDQLPDINEDSFKRPVRDSSATQSVYKSVDLPAAAPNFTPVYTSMYTATTTTTPVAAPAPTPAPEPEAVPVTVTKVEAHVKGRKGRFGSLFGSRTSKEGTVSALQTGASTVSITEVQPVSPVAAAAAAPAAQPTLKTVDLKDGWKMIAQRYGAAS